MKIGTAEELRKIDRFCIEELKIPGVILMENAALKVVKHLDLIQAEYFTIVCGKGNNGGDGFVIARHLYAKGKQIEVFLIGTAEGMSADCKTNYTILRNMGIHIKEICNVEDAAEFRESISRSEAVIDAIFGTGLTKPVEGIYDMVITIMNENSRYLLSIDVPSGMHSDSGKVMGNCISAQKTVTFQLYKKGFLAYGTDKYTGEIVLEDIGIPSFVVEKYHEKVSILDQTTVMNKLFIRDRYGHKGEYGRTFIIAGSKGFTGAAYMAAQAAVRSGAGLVTLCCDEEAQPILSAKLSEAMTLSSKDKEKRREFIEKSDSIAVGPGLGNTEETFNIVSEALKHAMVPVILDADGINVLKDKMQILKDRKVPVILTPHPGEMSRISGISIQDIQEHRMEIAKSFAKEYNVILLLKGYNTVITDGEVMIINPTGNSSMASGGMGDCLTGMIASFIGQGYKPFEATYLAAYIHGYCGSKLSKTMYSVNASHVIEAIPYIMKELLDEQINK